ncbi:IucA/IucC family protein [Stappia sp. 22II-S9-Z10]|nr:IucA/IucC family protein [Stappia sp. 22II-S9-Z10]
MPFALEDPSRPDERVLRQLAAALIHERIVDPHAAHGPDGTTYTFVVGQNRWRARGRIGPFERPRLVPGSVEVEAWDGWREGDAADLARALGGPHAATFAAELEATMAAGRRRPAGPRRHLDFAALESAIDEGHPYHPSFRALVGFSAEDHRRYGQGAEPFRLRWLLARRDRLRLEGDAARPGFLRYALGEAGWRLARRALAARGERIAAWGALPVHPFGWPALARRYAEEIRRGDMIALDGGDRYAPSQSIRTLLDVDRPAAPYVKLPLDVTNTSVRRALDPHTVLAAPALSAFLGRIVAADPVFAGRLPLAILSEHAGVVLDRDDEGADLRGAIWRRSVETMLQPGERAVPFTALALLEDDGRPFVEPFVARHGLSAWIDRLIAVAVLPVWHLLVAHGIAVEAHAQNLVLVLRDGWPVRIILRDLHDSAEYVDDFLPAGTHPPDFAAIDRAFRDAPADLHYWMSTVEELRWTLTDCLFVHNLTEVSALFAHAFGFPEAEFWRRVGAALRRHARDEGLADRLARLGHDRPKIVVERLVLRKLTPVADGAPLPRREVENPFHRSTRVNPMIEIDGRRFDRDGLAKGLERLNGGSALAPRPEQSFAVCHEDPAAWLAAFFALRDAGASVVPVHPASPPAAARRVATLAGCTHLLYGDAAAEVLPPPQRPLAPGHLVQMTSGTTSAPKPAARHYDEIEDELDAYVAAFTAPEGMTPVVAAPTSHSYGLICGTLAGLRRGMTPVVLTPGNPRHLLKVLAEVERPVLYASPAVLHTLARLMPADATIHAAMTSGTILPEPWFAAIRARVTHLFQQYGTSETGVVSVNAQTETAADMGQVLPHHTLADPGTAQTPAEIVVETPWRRVATRDLGYRRADGSLIFLSRLDDTINVAGLNVYPGEVEDAVMAMDGIADAVAFRLADPFAGERVGLIYSGARLDEASVRAWCSQKLARHQVPAVAQQVDAIPRQANGKINRREVATRYAAGEYEIA